MKTALEIENDFGRGDFRFWASTIKYIFEGGKVGQIKKANKRQIWKVLPIFLGICIHDGKVI